MDQHFINFAGIDPEQLKEQLAAGLGDAAILEWIDANARHKREPWEIILRYYCTDSASC